MDIDISDKMNPNTISYGSGWAAKIHTASNQEIKLYHEYIGINKNHRYFSNFMTFFPFLIKLEEGKFKDELQKIEQFRKNEFDRNIKEYGFRR